MNDYKNSTEYKNKIAFIKKQQDDAKLWYRAHVMTNTLKKHEIIQELNSIEDGEYKETLRERLNYYRLKKAGKIT